MKRRGQLQLSFGMIFSIIIIIATVGVAFYFIQAFLGTSDCTQVNIFNDELQTEIDKVWRAPQAQQLFSDRLPSGIKRVCFGDIDLAQNLGHSEEYLDLRVYAGNDANLFFYPSTEACDGDLAGKRLDHVDDSDFFCVDVVENKVELKLIKESSKDRLVKVEA